MVSGPKRPWPPRWSSPPSKAASSSACRSASRRSTMHRRLVSQPPSTSSRRIGRTCSSWRQPGTSVTADRVGQRLSRASRRSPASIATWHLPLGPAEGLGSTAQRSVRPSAPPSSLAPNATTSTPTPSPTPTLRMHGPFGQAHRSRHPDRRGRRGTRDAQRHERSRRPGDTPARSPANHSLWTDREIPRQTHNSMLRTDRPERRIHSDTFCGSSRPAPIEIACRSSGGRTIGRRLAQLSPPTRCFGVAAPVRAQTRDDRCRNAEPRLREGGSRRET